ncbi:hypothetical protein VTJ04DRAFT_2195 [Mycothermus thermophilus]|uniref:uncharacterized protein n=1 Tax=Humicola insolens TaxID=85995 RepID=UPI00374492A9
MSTKKGRHRTEMHKPNSKFWVWVKGISVGSTSQNAVGVRDIEHLKQHWPREQPTAGGEGTGYQVFGRKLHNDTAHA